jgi:nitroreductase
MKIEEIFYSRRSIRKFKTTKPSRELIQSLIEIGITAPSASNHQPWKFFIVEDQVLLQKMVAAVKLQLNLFSKKIEPEFLNKFMEYGENYFIRFGEAPYVIVPAFRNMPGLTQMSNDLNIEEKQIAELLEFKSSIISTSLAIQNILLYANQIGLGTSCMTGPLLAEKQIKELVGIPECWGLAGLIPVGYPDEIPEKTNRKSIEKIITWK